MRCCVSVALLCLACTAFAQQAPPPASSTAAAQAINAEELVTREFGKTFTIVGGFAPVVGDFDGDGTQDLAVVVASKTPLVDELEFHYKAIDPYDAYWGWGNAHETVKFSATDAGATRYVAVVHNWQKPAAKFLVINLPFEKLTASRVAMKKKKSIDSIHAIESSGLESDVFWDGKKYKWEAATIN